jgi:hypothetical protein
VDEDRSAGDAGRNTDALAAFLRWWLAHVPRRARLSLIEFAIDERFDFRNGFVRV